MLAVIIISVIIYLFIQAISSMRKPKKFPPGPPWLPIVGSAPAFRKAVGRHSGAMYLGFEELAKQYKTQVLGLKLGMNPIVCVFGYEKVKELLLADEFNGRPLNFFYKLRSFMTFKGLTFTEDAFWREQRNFVERHLRDVGYGKKEMKISTINECHEIIQYIKENGPDINIHVFFSPNFVNVLWDLLAGKKFERNNKKLQEFLRLMKLRNYTFDANGGLLSQFPWLRFIAPDYCGYNFLMKLNNGIKKFFKDEITEHYETDTGEKSDLIYAFIQEMKSHENESSEFSEEQLIMICIDLFIAGSQTTNSMMGFIFYCLLLYPDAKDKILKEIDDNIPGTRLPELADRFRLPYFEAFLTETKRMFPVTTLAGPRRVIIRDYEMDGYTLKKGTTVFASIWSVHMDKTYWKDPEVFRPERFIRADGKFFPNERVLNFGLGKRRCLGEQLAKDCIFLFTASILQAFDVSPLDKMILKTGYSGMIMSPDPFKVRFTRR